MNSTDRPKFVFVFGTENDRFSVFGQFRFRPKTCFMFSFSVDTHRGFGRNLLTWTMDVNCSSKQL